MNRGLVLTLTTTKTRMPAVVYYECMNGTNLLLLVSRSTTNTVPHATLDDTEMRVDNERTSVTDVIICIKGISSFPLATKNCVTGFGCYFYREKDSIVCNDCQAASIQRGGTAHS